ncbi:MAG: PAS domain S-box protein [Betaproteobacteria bacterium]|nr:PAS domain S-box protein [Betaproteobacteria bacterium]
MPERLDKDSHRSAGDAGFRAIFEQAAVGIGVRALDGRWLQVNQKLCDIFGYSRAEMLATTSVVLTPAEDRETSMTFNRRMARGELDTYTREKRYLRKDGSDAWVNLSMSVVRDEAGQPSYVIAVLADITPARIADQRLQAAIEHLNESVILSDSQDRIVFANRRAREANRENMQSLQPGRSFEEHLRARLAAGHFPDADGREEEWLALRLAEHRKPTGPVERRRRDGRWMQTHDQRTPDGRTVTIGLDITERKLSEDQLRTALEHLGEMIVLTDSEDRIVVANQRFLEFNAPVAEYAAPGRFYEEHLRAGIALGLFPGAAGREETWLAERMALRRNPQGPVERQRQDGRWLLVDDQRLPDGSTISFGLEITERKRAETALRDMNAELERRVDERTALLKKTNRELEAFSYSVSHDLRAPLRAISGFAGILLEEEAARLSAEGRRYLATIDANAQRMGKLIDGLLSLGKLSRHELVRQRINMAALAREACDELAQHHPRARVEIGPLPGAQGDTTLVRQVFQNLIGNALKYSSRSATPRIEIGAEQADGMLAFYVRDNGAGFDMAYASKLFKPFERLHADHDFEGTGIGLAVTHMIVQRHGGRIWAEGEPDRGATFHFTLE